MIEFITKADYFGWEDAGLKLPRRGNIKDAQDGFILSLVNEMTGKRLLEMGGGDSRVLRRMTWTNECWNAEKFKGTDGGPSGIVEIPRVKNVYAYLGENCDQLPSEYFDVAFSISVVEHIPSPNLPSVFRDLARVLRPGGLCAHAIDMYLLDENKRDHPHNNQVVQRLKLYQSVEDWTGGLLRLVDPPRVETRPVFQSEYATNSDLATMGWNQIGPSLRPLREIAQGVSLKCKWQRVA